MGTEKLSGSVIREQVKGESNKQIVVLAKGLGRVILSARGARKANSRLLAATQLFCYADFVVYEGKGFYPTLSRRKPALNFELFPPYMHIFPQKMNSFSVTVQKNRGFSVEHPYVHPCSSSG